MARLAPFAGWRYDPGSIDMQAVVAPPYDVIDADEQEALYARDPHNVIRLILGAEQPGDTAQHNQYTRAAAHLAAWRDERVLRHDREALYLCEQTFEFDGATHTRRGFFCRVLLEAFGEGAVYPHERTLSGPKADRLRLMQACRGNLSPVFGLLSDDTGALTEGLGQLVDWEPTVTVTDGAGVASRFWVVDHQEKIDRLCHAAHSEGIYIADGHHRYETALNYRNEVREAMCAAGVTPPPLGELASDWIMMLCVPLTDPGLVIGPTHRLVHDIDGFDGAALLAGCEKHFAVTPAEPGPLVESLGVTGDPVVFGLALGDACFRLALRDVAAMAARAPDMPDPWQALDVSVLHLLILEDLLGIDEDRLLRKTNIYYERSAEAALQRARSDSAVQCAFLMRPTTMAQVRAVSKAGEVMPQKSTYFYPKVPSGLVFHLFW